MQNKQPEALRIAALLESVILDIPPTAVEIGIAALLRTQHAALERKDALLRQALDALELAKEACDSSFTKYDATIEAIKQELSQ